MPQSSILASFGRAGSETSSSALLWRISIAPLWSSAILDEPYEGTFRLPDPDDEHVVAAAVAGHAGAIVTVNLKDFPQDKIPPGIEILIPSEFAANTAAVSPQRALKAVVKLTQRRQNPPISVDDFLATLQDKYGMHEAVDLINEVR